MKFSDLFVANSVNSGDYLIGLVNPLDQIENKLIAISTLMSNVNSISINNLILANNHTPTSNSDTIVGGTMFYTNTHLYIAISNNALRRVALTTF